MKLANGTAHKTEDNVTLPDTSITVTLIKKVKQDFIQQALLNSHKHSKELCVFATTVEQNVKAELLKKIERANEEKKECMRVIEEYQKMQKIQDEIMATSNREINKAQGDIEEKKKTLSLLQGKLRSLIKTHEELQNNIQNLISNEMKPLILSQITSEITEKIHYVLSSKEKDYKLISVITSVISLIKGMQEIDYITVNVRYIHKLI